MQHKEVKALRKAVETMYNCKALYIKSKAVHEIFEGKTAWKGEVAIFKIQRHPATTRCYAWSFKEGDETKSVAVLEIPPVDSAESAVRLRLPPKRAQNNSAVQIRTLPVSLSAIWSARFAIS